MSDRNISEDDKVTSENEQSDDNNVKISSDDSSSKYSSNNDSDGLFNVKSNMNSTVTETSLPASRRFTLVVSQTIMI